MKHPSILGNCTFHSLSGVEPIPRGWSCPAVTPPSLPWARTSRTRTPSSPNNIKIKSWSILQFWETARFSYFQVLDLPHLADLVQLWPHPPSPERGHPGLGPLLPEVRPLLRASHHPGYEDELELGPRPGWHSGGSLWYDLLGAMWY